MELICHSVTDTNGFLAWLDLLITALKRSLGKGNVFTQFCLCVMSLPVWLPGPMFLPGESLYVVPCSFWQRGLCLWSHVPSRGLCLWSHVPARHPSQRPPHPTPWTETSLDWDTPRYHKERAVRSLQECLLYFW